MVKIFLVIVLLISSLIPLTAQVAGNMKYIYQVQLEVVDGKPEKEKFSRFENLGFLTFYSEARGPEDATTPTRVCLGPYLGKVAAERIVIEARSLGYKDAFFYLEDSALVEDGEPLTHTIQLGAFVRPNLSLYKNLSNFPARGLIITYEAGMYKLLSGLYAAKKEEYLKSTMLPYYKHELGLDCFIRTIQK